MAKTTKSKGRSAGTYTIGRDNFSKISEVEGIKTSPQLKGDFKEFDRNGLSAAERRRALAQKYRAKR